MAKSRRKNKASPAAKGPAAAKGSPAATATPAAAGRGGAEQAASSAVADRAGRGSPEWLVLGLALLGMAITSYLSLVALLGSAPAFCSEGSSCDLVQQSRWSSLLGMPIALWGFLLYALLAVLAWRMPARLKRWRRLWMLSFIGVCISIYLTVAAAWSLGVFCAWCLLSLFVICAILLSLLLRRPVSAPGMGWGPWLLSSAGLGLPLVLALHVATADIGLRPENPRLAALATHLDGIGAKYYGAYWCPACQKQARSFGTARHRLPYVECSPAGRGSPMAPVCVNADISSFPTWIIHGRRYERVMEPRELAELSGFAW